MQILQATLDHVETVAILFDQYRQFYKQKSDIAAARNFISDRIRRNESVIFLALDDDGKTGLGFTQLYPSFSSESMMRFWILNDLFVAPAARRTGTGKALMLRARKQAADTGAKGLNLETAIDNRNAQVLYEGLGWKRDEEFYRYNLIL